MSSHGFRNTTPFTELEHIEQQQDWLHLILSKVIGYDAKQQQLLHKLHQQDISETDIAEIVSYVDQLSPILKADFLQKVVLQTGAGDYRSNQANAEKLQDANKPKMKGHFRNRVLSFRA